MHKGMFYCDDFSYYWLNFMRMCVRSLLLWLLLLLHIPFLHAYYCTFYSLNVYFTYAFQFQYCLHMWWHDDGLHCLLFTIKMNFIHCHFLLTHKIYYSKFNIADISVPLLKYFFNTFSRICVLCVWGNPNDYETTVVKFNRDRAICVWCECVQCTTMYYMDHVI